MTLQQGEQLAQIIRQEIVSCTVEVKTTPRRPDDALISVRINGSYLEYHQLQILLKHAGDSRPVIYSNPDGLFFMFH